MTQSEATHTAQQRHVIIERPERDTHTAQQYYMKNQKRSFSSSFILLREKEYIKD
jgi:hypothetical protein